MAKGLTKKQGTFVAEYLVDLNATRAAVAAGYSKKGAEQTGSVLLRNPKVSEQIAKKHGKRLEKLDISADKVLAEIAKVAFFDPRKLFDENGLCKPIKDLDDETAMAVAGLEVFTEYEGKGDDRTESGVTRKVKLADKLRALELYGRHLKLFTDKHEHSGKVTLEGLVCGGAEDE